MDEADGTVQETRKMRFEGACGVWQSGRLSQEEAAILHGVRERTFRRSRVWDKVSGLEGLIDQRLKEITRG